MIKFTSVSGDLMVKLGLGVLILGGIALIVHQLKSKISTGTSTIVDAVNPASTSNVIYTTMNKAFDGGDRNFTVGGWIYDKTHPTYDPNARTSLPITPGFSNDENYPIPISII